MMYTNFKVFMGLIFMLSSGFAVGQSNILNASTPSEVGVLSPEQKASDDDEPLEYGYISDRDILWSKVVWEKIDLRQKVNFPLLYPTQDDVFSSNRRSLFKTLMEAIELGAKDPGSKNAITEVYATSYFNKKKSFDDILSSTKSVFLPDVALDILGQYGVTGTESVQQFINRSLAGTLSNYPDQYPQDLISQMEPYLIPTEITSRNILEYHIKGMWYFDKLQGELRYRLLGIAPAGYDIQSQNQSFAGEPEIIPYFWVWYPSARYVLYNAKVLNNDNSSEPFSFDHLLNSRRFDSFIYKTQNVYEDREVNEYIQDNSLLQLLESQRIKEEIRNFELDMWSY
ncbi:gliding motility protein GldN [Psychroflexus sp. YR1-1]|uniref:Gliding motility protein GldN n=1 Tax=Psychroflexus aurantiacus TaxID=2709310 RepID=A0A6B3R378_9FLAO|nr:gliding motility protein GldN [Psychroflexus aurantiacus]NEV94832.1 gliding motility protein GldN [Psychroflexus aurantiacus]